jgi:hypothetical protein
MDPVTPLFIFGMGRSGTTNALRVANAHPCVMMNGEIPLPVLKQFLATLDAADRAHSDTREGWLARKPDYMFESFGYLSKGGRGRLHRRATATHMGHKTPRLESLFDDYEAHFASAGLAPRYIYCARNPFDCWRSYKAMPWNRYDEVTAFLAHYVASFERLDHVRERAGTRMLVLNLDELIAADDKVAFYRDRFFAPLGLDMPERTVRRIENISAAKSGPRPAELGAEERSAIEAYPGIAALNAEMFAPFKPSLR